MTQPRLTRSAMRRAIAGLAAALLLVPHPAAAQSELRDAETEAVLNDMSRPLILAAGLSPRTVRIVLLNDDSINAFTAGGQTVYVNSGLIQAADNANQVQGVIAHELGHVADGHVVLADRGAKPAIGITLLSLVLAAAAAAAGAPEAGAGILSAGTTAAQYKYLAFSRVQESTADATGMKFLNQANISGRGMLSFFKKLQNEEYAYGLKNIDPYAQSHPLSGERISALTAGLTASPAWNNKPDAALEQRFTLVKAKLRGYIAPYQQTLNVFPESDLSLPAHYARAYAWHKAGYPDKADAEVGALVAARPEDPYFQEIKGQILLEAGKPAEALPALRAAVANSGNAPLIATTLGHALIATEDKANYGEAVKVLRLAVARDDENPFAWYQLGVVYELTGDSAHAMLATAERASMSGDPRTAAYSARGALAGLPVNSPDWIRAQDIALAAQNEMDDDPKKYKRR